MDQQDYLLHGGSIETAIHLNPLQIGPLGSMTLVSTLPEPRDGESMWAHAPGICEELVDIYKTGPLPNWFNIFMNLCHKHNNELFEAREGKLVWEGHPYVIVDSTAPLVNGLTTFFSNRPTNLVPLNPTTVNVPMKTTFWVISTAHMPSTEPDFQGLAVRRRPEGFRIVLPVCAWPQERDLGWLELIRKHAPQHDCCVVFDCGVGVVTSVPLPTYDW